MHALLANLMTLSLVFHAALGCCWHHEHHCRHKGEAAECESACCEHCEEHGSPSNESPHPCGCKVECRGICTYVPPQKIEFDSSLAVAPFISAASVTLLSGTDAALGSAWRTVDPVELEPPLRLHLLHQIVLI